MRSTIRIAPDLKLDADYVGSGTFALLAKKGAGKSYTARVMCEEMWAAEVPFVLMDPMGTSWGLRTSVDGESEGIPVAIFGGEKGDAPLERTSGAVMADLVVDEGLSMVLDLSSLGSRSAERQFCLDFLERLYRRNRELVHVLMDEADLFAPQKHQQGDLPLLGATENVVRRGRNRGIGITLMTQRPAVLNKDVLTQVDGLVAMRMVGLTDREAIDKWMEGHGDDPEEAKKVKASLAGLENGECWWWIPELGILKKIHVREAHTFDSSPSKKRGKRRRAPKGFAEVDMGVIQDKMAKTIERAKAQDPRELQKQVRDLKREIAERPTELEPVEVIKEVPVFSDEEREDIAILRNEFKAGLEDVQSWIGTITPQIEKLYAGALRAHAESKGTAIREERQPASGADGHRSGAGRVAPSPSVPAAPRTSGGDTGELRGLPLELLKILWSLDRTLSKTQLATLAGKQAKGGHFNNVLSNLRTRGFITGSKELRITQEGMDELGEQPLPMTHEELVSVWKNTPKIRGLPSQILDLLLEAHPDAVAKDDLAAMLGKEPTGGHFNNCLSALRSNDLAVNEGGGLRASDSLFLV